MFRSASVLARPLGLSLRAVVRPTPRALPFASTFSSTSSSLRTLTTTPARPQAQPQPPSPAPHELHPLLMGAELPPPEDIPPISQRLKPLIPFIIWWTIITSLIVHSLRMRKEHEAELDRAHAQESVLRGIKTRFEAGELVADIEIRRELEMVGLRERTNVTAHLADELAELRNVTWIEMLLGRKTKKDAASAKHEPTDVGVDLAVEKNDDEVVKEWTKIVNEASAEKAPVLDPLPEKRTGVAKRATSSNVYM